MSIVRGNFSIAPSAEFTVEANPNSLEPGHWSLFKDQGVNRLSLGIQSFSDDILRMLGRPHTALEGSEAFQRARQSGINNIGIDLMFGIPGQTEDHWRRTLTKTLELKPEHVSAYSLSLDRGSQFKRMSDAGTLSLPHDDIAAGQYELLLNELEEGGYERYEISNFSLSGFSCRHNLHYWNRGEYIGLGPAAWSFVENRRYGNIADVDEYCALLKRGSSVIDHQETVSSEEAADETIMLSCRTVAGLDLKGYEQRYGEERSNRLERAAGPLVRSGLMKRSGRMLQLTGNGFLVADAVFQRLIS